MRVLGLDVGDRRIGVALSDETGVLASPLSTLQRVGPRKDLKAIVALVREHGAGAVVVGLPYNLDGTIGPQAEKVRAFAEALEPAVKVPVRFWDERLTSVEAEEILAEREVPWQRRKGLVDQVAAVLILQGYLDAQPRPAPAAS
ncbi:MAG TPA: Holliday junction resolvase RuvX [Vicinamibacteria bacterium]|nr:Holliday junction resolvase RuvX [Vicinamibacteria bacterium]